MSLKVLVRTRSLLADPPGGRPLSSTDRRTNQTESAAVSSTAPVMSLNISIKLIVALSVYNVLM